MLQRRKSTNAPYNLLFSKHRNMDVCCPQVTRRYEILSATVYDCFSRKLKSLWFCDPSIKKLANNEHRFSLSALSCEPRLNLSLRSSREMGGGGHRACASKQKWPACSPPSDRSETNSSSLIVTRLVKQLGEQQERILASSVS